jgi:hypothetical protein
MSLDNLEKLNLFLRNGEYQSWDFAVQKKMMQGFVKDEGDVCPVIKSIRW